MREGKLLQTWQQSVADRFEELYPGVDVHTGSGIFPCRIHQMVMTEDGVIYAGRIDNNYRSTYLWEESIV